MTPTIAIVNRFSEPLPWTVDRLVEALGEYAGLLHDAWGVDVLAAPWDSAMAAEPQRFWPLVLADDSDTPGALAYHTTDWKGPWGIAFLKSALAIGKDASIPIGHEFAEMAADPLCMQTFRSLSGDYASGEIVDPVQEESFLAKNGLRLPNFVWPEWFGLANPGEGTNDGRKDQMCICTSAGQILPGGYISKWTAAAGWQEVWGDSGGQVAVAGKLAEPLSRLNRRRAA